MPEIDKAAGAGDGGGEGGNADDQNQDGAGENKGDQNSDDGAGNGDEKNKDDKGDGSSNDAGDDKSGDDDGDDEEPEVRIRKTPKDFIIERQARKIEKLKGAQEKDDKDDKGDDNDDNNDDDVDPEDEKLIKKVASRMIAPIYQKQAEAEDAQEVKDFVAKNQDFAKYEKKVLSRMKHPSRAQMPIKSIFYEVAGDDLLKIGADRAKKAEDEAARGNSGGGSARGDDDGGTVDYSKMTASEFEKKREEVRQKSR